MLQNKLTNNLWFRAKLFESWLTLSCEHRRISGCRLSPPKNNVCEPEPTNDFCDVGILSQSQFSSNSPRTTARGIRCEKHSSFILSWNLIGQRGNKSHYVTEIVSWLGFADVIFWPRQATARNTSAFAG